MKRFACVLLILLGTGTALASRLPEGIPPMGFRPLPLDVAMRHAKLVPMPAALPESLDWRTQGIVTPPKQQLDCGACWAFAGIACIESMCLLAGANSGIDLSEQFPISCDVLPLPGFGGFHNDGCCGGSCTIFEFLTHNMAIAEIRFPFGNGDFDGNGPRDCATRPGWNTVPCPSELPGNSGWRVAGWNLIFPQPVPGVLQLKTALQSGPVWVGYYVYQDFITYWMSGDPETPYRHVSGPLVGGHAVLLIGYNDARQCWIVKNSWGFTGPSRNGTFLVDYNANCDFGINAAQCTVVGDDVPVERASLGSLKAMFR